MKKFVAIMMIIVLVSILPTKVVRATGAEIVVGGSIAKVILELIVSTAVSYELAEKISDVSLTEMLGIGFHSTHPNYMLEDADIRHIDELGRSQELKMEVIYEGTKIKVKYSDGQEYDGTDVDGKQLFVNPLVVNALVESGQWQIVLQANETLKSLSITSLYSMSLALGQDITEFQNARNKAMSQCVTAVAYAMQQVREYYKPQEGLTPEDIFDIENNQTIQMLRFKNIPDTLKDQYNTSLKTVMNQKSYYLMYNDRGTIVIMLDDNPITITGTINASYWHQYYYNTNTKQYLNICTLVNMTSAYYDKYLYIPIYSNCPQIKEVFDVSEFPYPLNSTDTEELVATDIPIGVISGLTIGLGQVIPRDNVLDMPEEKIKETFGDVIDGEYEVETEIKTPNVEDAQVEYNNTILGWLSRIWNAIINIPSSILNGLLEILKELFEWLFVPDQVVLDGIVTNVNDTLNQKTGVLTYPITASIRFLNMTMNVNNEDCILKFPRMVIGGREIFKGQDYNLSASVRNGPQKDIYYAYMRVTDLILIGYVLRLAIDKFKSVINGEMEV